MARTYRFLRDCTLIDDQSLEMKAGMTGREHPEMKNQTLIMLIIAGACGLVVMLGVKQYLSLIHI